MSGVNSSTLGSAVLSDADNKKPHGFDLRSWQGLTQVLKVARESGMADDVYAEFRNAVLRYAQSGGDPELKKQIDHQISQFSVKKSEPEMKRDNEEGKKDDDIKEGAENNKKKERRERQKRNRENRIAQPKKIETGLGTTGRSTPSFSAKASLDADTKQADAGKRSEVDVVTEQTPPPQQKVLEGKQNDVTKAEAPKPGPVVASDTMGLEKAKARIVEIKRQVTTEIGNPIVIIDSGNPIGRNYMAALLDAMKGTAGGRAGALQEKMKKLEEVFRELIEYNRKANASHRSSETQDTKEEEVVKRPEPETQKPEPKPEQKNIPPIMKEEEKVGPREQRRPEIQKPEPFVDTRKETSIPKVVETVKKDEILSFSEKAVKSPEKLSVQPDSPKSDLEEVKEKKPEKKKWQLPDLSRESKESIRKEEKWRKDGPKENIASSLNESAIEKGVLAGRGDEKSLDQQLIGESIVAAKQILSHQSELQSAEVTEGLNTLLNEWSLFKPSGLLGLGPSGNDHPLYKELAVLPMSVVLAGRWKGATPEANSILKDYVNAWLNEQGVSYNGTETFEHYLRRVVERVLRRQRVRT